MSYNPGRNCHCFGTKTVYRINSMPTDNLSATPSQMNEWREHILNAILKGTFVFSILSFLSGLSNVIQTYQQVIDPVPQEIFRALFVAGLYTTGTLIISLITFVKQISYSVRSLTMLSVFYSVGVVGLYISGLSGDGRVFLFAVNILTAILVGRRGAVIALVTTIFTLILMAFLFVTGRVQISPPFQANSTDPSAWTSGIFVFTLLNVAAVISATYLVSRLEKSLRDARHNQTDLQRSEQYYRALFDNSADAVALIDSQGTVLYASPSTWRVIGYTAEEYSGRNVFADIHPDDLALAQGFLGKMLTEPGLLTLAAYRVKNKAGMWRWLEGSVHNLSHEMHVGAIVINYRDITERRASELALQESEARLQRLNGVLRTVTEINQLIVREQDRQSLLDQVCQLLIRHRDYIFTWIGLLNEDETVCHFAAASTPVTPSHYTFRPHDPAHRLSCIAAAIKTHTPVTTASDLCTFCPINPSPPDHTSLALPIIRNEHTLGVWVVYASRTNLFDQEEISLLQNLSNDLAYALENIHIEQQRQRRTEQQQALAETVTHFLSAFNLNHLLETITEAARRTLNADRIALYRYDLETDRVTCPYAWGLSAGYVEAVNHQFRNIPGFRILSIPEPLIVNDITTNTISGNMREKMIAEGFRSYAVFPLHGPAYTIGGLVIYRDQAAPFTRGDIATGQTLAHLVAVALQNVQLFNALEKRAEEAETLRQVGAVVAATLEPDKTIEMILQQLARVIPYDSASVQLLREGYLEIVGGRGWPDMNLVMGMRFPIPGNNPNTTVIQDRKPQIINNVAEKHTKFQQNPHSHIISWLGIPLVVRERVIGMLAIDSKSPGFFREEHARLVEAFGDQVAVALENARLFEETSRRAAELSSLIQLSTSLRMATTRDEMLSITLDHALALLHVDEGAIFEPVPGQKILRVVKAQRWARKVRELDFGFADSIAGHVFVTGEITASSDLSQEPNALPSVASFLKENGPRSGIYVPLRSGKETVGVLCADTMKTRVFKRDEINLLTAIAEIAGSALHRANVLETLEHRVRERTAELTEANEQLRELDKLKDEFVTNVNHELRTPLTNITMYLDLLAARGATSLERYLPVLRRESKRLAQLIEDLLTLSRLEQGRVTFDPTPQRLDNLLTDVLQSYEARLRQRQLTVVHEPNPEIPAILMDRAQIMQVLTNLLGNAVAYTPVGGQVACHVNWTKEGNRYVEVSIRNSGEVIPPEELPHLFERFFRGKTGRDSGEAGTGLGLSICKEIVARHGGHMNAESTREQGITIRFWLPAF